MEESLDDILDQLSLDPFDLRIRGWLEQALARYERAWSLAGRLGIGMDEKMAPAVYAHCLLKVIGSEGVKIPDSLWSPDQSVQKLIAEVFK